MKDNITIQDYFGNDQMRMDIFKSKYLKNKKQTIDQCFDNIAKEISLVSSETQSAKLKALWKNDLLEGIWRPGGSIIAGINNKSKKISLFNCTTVKIEDDTLEAIYSARYECAKMAAHRQGIGIEFSELRPKGAPVNNSSEVSEGVINWISSFNSIAEEVGQRGRRPAILSAIKDTHPDVIEFIKAKSDLDNLKNMNLSIQISDKFMEAVVNNEKWELYFDLKNERISKTINARYMFELLCKQSHEFAEPGIQFIDRMKDGSIQEALGYKIVGTNACSEKPLPNYGVCALASLNMEEVPFITDDKFHNFMKEKVYSLVRFMDNVVQYEIDNDYKSPLKKQLKIVNELREIGLGITNLHLWFYNNNIKYESDAGIDAVGIFFKWYQYYAFKASCDLAIEREPCIAWQNAKKNDTIKETIFLKNLFEEFDDLKKLFYNTGIRNGALLSVAPTGSISMTFPNECLSSGIEPTIGYAYWRKTRAVSRGDYDHYFILPNVIKSLVLSKMNDDNTVDKSDYDLVNNFNGSILDNGGKIGERLISIVHKYIDTDLLKPAHKIDPFKKVKLMKGVQRWVDAAISVTYNLPADFNLGKIGDMYIDAWKSELKALSVYREGSREGILIFESPAKQKIINTNEECQVDNLYRPESIKYHCAPKRSRELICKIHHCSVEGEKWIVLIGLLNNEPYEVFAGKKNEYFNISENIKEGLVIKNHDTYSLKIPFKGSHIEYNDITALFMNVEYEALTRMISLSLRHGVYHDFIINQLKKSSAFVSDFMAVVSRVLNMYKMIKVNSSDNSCPDCDAILLDEGSCMKCLSCGYSRCD
jgi:ribonucleoside-diphosphate reductase alpha chain